MLYQTHCSSFVDTYINKLTQQ